MAEGTSSMPGSLIFWERGRILYNAMLAAVVAWVVLTWPHFSQADSGEGVRFLISAALIANILYSVVNSVDVPLSYSRVSAEYRKWRWGLWLVGMLIALLLENYWIADEIYPFAR